MNLSLQAFLLLTFISLNAFAKPTMFDLQFIASQQKPGQKCAQLAEDYGQEFTAETKAPVFDTVAQELEGNDFNLCRITIRYAAESRVPVTRIDLSQMENCDIALSYIAQTIPKISGLRAFAGACEKRGNKLHYLALGSTAKQLKVIRDTWSLSKEDKVKLLDLIVRRGGIEPMTNDYSVLYFSENGVDVVDNSNIAIIYSTHFNTPEACKVQQDDVTKMYLKAGAADPVALCDYESSFGGWSFFNVYQEAGFVLPSGQITLVDVPKTYSSFQACIADKARVVAFYSNNMAFTADFAFCSHTNQLIDASVLQLIAVH